MITPVRVMEHLDELARTLAQASAPSSVLLVMTKGSRICLDRGGAVAIRVLTGELELHVGDEWDQLPYPVRHIEGACSFFALFDHSIDLSGGNRLALDPDMRHDIEALDDSAFVLEFRTAEM